MIFITVSKIGKNSDNNKIDKTLVNMNNIAMIIPEIINPKKIEEKFEGSCLVSTAGRRIYVTESLKEISQLMERKA